MRGHPPITRTPLILTSELDYKALGKSDKRDIQARNSRSAKVALDILVKDPKNKAEVRNLALKSNLGSAFGRANSILPRARWRNLVVDFESAERWRAPDRGGSSRSKPRGGGRVCRCDASIRGPARISHRCKCAFESQHRQTACEHIFRQNRSLARPAYPPRM
jgi:hypothetical protein